MASIDLKDAYYHVPIHAESQKYLRVAVKIDSKIIHLQYRVFTKIIAERVSHMREGVGTFIPYLDEFLLVGESSQMVQVQLERTLEILKKVRMDNKSRGILPNHI